jgi:hypothetical protein
MKSNFLKLSLGLFLSVAFVGGAYAKTGAPASVDFLQLTPAAPTYPVYVFDSSNKQVAYMTSASDQVFLGPYNANTSGVYNFYYQNQNIWYACTLTMQNGAIVGNSGASYPACPSATLISPAQNKEPGSNVWTLAFGAKAWEQTELPSGVVPVNKTYTNRTITFVNNTQYPLIQVGEVCTVSSNPSNPNCVNNPALFSIAQGKTAVFYVDKNSGTKGNYPGLISYGFTLTGYQDAKGQMVQTGGYNTANPYATKLELTSLPVTTQNGIQIPSGPTNIDVSAVDGYNMGVIIYPETSKYCTYTKGGESSGNLGVNYYSQQHVLAQLAPQEGTSLAGLCAASSQLPGDGPTAWPLSLSNGDDFMGCMSPCTYATKTFGATSSQAQQYCCTGAYNTPATCTLPAQSTYLKNMNPPVSERVYRFAYDDAVGDHACPAETNLIVEFVSGTQKTSALTLSGVISDVTTTTARLTWRVSDTDPKAGNITYTITGATTPVISANTALFSKLTPDTTYNVMINAVDQDGNKASVPYQFKTQAAPPVHYTLSLSNVAASNVTQTGATLNWQVADNDPKAGNITYTITGATTPVINGTTATFSGLTAGTTYNVTINAADSDGNKASMPYQFKTQAAPVHYSLSVSNVAASNVTQTGATLNWQVADNDPKAGNITYTITGATTPVINGTTATFSGLTAGTTYNVTINAADSDGNKASVPYQFTTQSKPTPPPPSGNVLPVNYAYGAVYWNQSRVPGETCGNTGVPTATPVKGGSTITGTLECRDSDSIVRAYFKGLTAQPYIISVTINGKVYQGTVTP